MNEQRLKELISQQNSLRRETMLKKNQNPDDRQKYHLYDAATEAEIDAVERERGLIYPESYRAFLRLHNGWLGFWPDWSLVGAPRDENKVMFDDIRMNFDLLPDVVGDDELSALAEKEKLDDKVIKLDGHLIFGTDFNGSFLVFDQNRVDASGEPEVAWVHYLQHVEDRWKTFEDLLQAAVDRTRRKLEALETRK